MEAPLGLTFRKKLQWSDAIVVVPADD